MKDMKEKLQKEAYLQSLKNGATRVAAAEAATICTTTVWNWRQADEEFSKAEQIALESRVNIVVDSLYENAKGYEYVDKKGTKRTIKGNIIAQIFYLKNRGKGRWTDKTEIEYIAPRVVKRNAFIQAGEEPVIKEEEEVPEKETLINGDNRVVLKLNGPPEEKKDIVVQTETNKSVKTVL